MTIKTLKLSNLAKKHKPNSTWSREARQQAVGQYLILGNMALVSAVTGIPHQLLRSWKTKPWWNEMTEEIRATETLQMDAKLNGIVSRSLDAVIDRVENGEFQYNAKTKEMVRVPAALKDLTKVSVEMLNKRELLRGNATERKETTTVSIGEQLNQLALEFAKWNQNSRPVQVIDVKAEEIEIEDVLEVQDSETIDGVQSEESDEQEAGPSTEV